MREGGDGRGGVTPAGALLTVEWSCNDDTNVLRVAERGQNRECRILGTASVQVRPRDSSRGAGPSKKERARPAPAGFARRWPHFNKRTSFVSLHSLAAANPKVPATSPSGPSFTPVTGAGHGVAVAPCCRAIAGPRGLPLIIRALLFPSQAAKMAALSKTNTLLFVPCASPHGGSERALREQGCRFPVGLPSYNAFLQGQLRCLDGFWCCRASRPSKR